MKLSWMLVVPGMMMVVAGCGQQRQAPKPQPATVASNELRAAVPVPGTGPDARTPFGPEKAAADPKSTEAAVDLVKGFVRLLNQHRFDEAYMLLGPGAPPRSDFDRQFAHYSNLKVAIGAAGDQEGAAGSIYLSVPLTISSEISGKRQSRSATAIVRRVNDVPGSTEAQRRWHIERIDWSD